MRHLIDKDNYSRYLTVHNIYCHSWNTDITVQLLILSILFLIYN